MNLLFSLFNVGDCVVFTNTQEKGWIVFKHPPDETDEFVKLDIKMNLDGRVEKQVSSNDIVVIPYEDIETSTRVITRSNVDLGLNIDESVSNNTDRTNTNHHNIDSDMSINATVTDEFSQKSLFDAIQECFSWRVYDSNNRLYQLLKSGPQFLAILVLCQASKHRKSTVCVSAYG